MPHAHGATQLRRAATVAALIAFAAATPAAADEPVRFDVRLAASTHYSADVQMTHTITYDMNSVLRKLAGSKADPVTILEQRSVDVAAAPNGAVDETIADTRHYGGAHPKNTSVVRRTTNYKGVIASNGKRTPTGEPLVDAGDGALAELPEGPVAVGQTWTFSRQILVDRELGQGTMTYTDTLTKIDDRNGHRIAVIAVKGQGRVDVAKDLKAKGFQTTDMTFAGSAEFDLTSGLPGVQHYTAHAQWNTRILMTHLGLIFDDTYDAAAWTPKGH